MDQSLTIAIALVLFVISAIFLFVRIERERRNARARARAAIARIEQALNISTDLNVALPPALDAILEFTHAAAASVWRADPQSGTLMLAAQRGLFPERLADAAAPTRHCWDNGKTVRLTRLDEIPALRDKGFVEYLCVPLTGAQGSVGVLDVAARHSGELDTFTVEWLETLSPALALALGASRQLTASQAREREARQLWEAGLQVASERDYAQLLRTVVDHARELIGGQASALCLWDEQKRWMVVQGASGTQDAFEVTVKRFERPNGMHAECPVVRFKYRRPVCGE
jgi:transcriptional regulator with GAF, ATPase, and Fis domain